jgi:hypothetical protein
VELTEFFEIRSHVFVVGRQIGVGSFVALRSPIKARTLPW